MLIIVVFVFLILYMTFAASNFAQMMEFRDMTDLNRQWRQQGQLFIMLNLKVDRTRFLNLVKQENGIC